MSAITQSKTKAPVNNNSSLGSRVFDALNVIVLVGLALITVLPLLYVLAGSFAGESEISSRPFFLWPEKIVTESYEYIFATDTFVRALITTVVVTAVGTVVQLGLTFTMAYPLAKRYLPGRALVLNLVIFTLVFTGGMIPTYLVVRDLGLLDSYWALILPLAINPFYLIIIKSFFQELPQALEEAARIDGANEMGVFFKIVLPLSKPIIATFSLFYAVAIWNDYMSPLLYINDPNKWTLQILVRQLTNTDAANALAQMDRTWVPPEQGLKFAVVVIATLPILFFYPFLQKHFAKGVLIGSVKE
ncbi:carbohydrate ABC transporter permease [Nonomuraea muscovyensis]|uniref:Putative aldouronate transport system permease protein n=1 Tax=Nonomuraea muscovyensis TaxID=1124761 RepID=A0A7X0C4M3_9ACTN|nr:carbohydrate ABC transporter permease [Nonomuraea muscovyensis]MBB6348415.1 putative aldouronate transport system permease protein [Nonomuraea muscovyensis]MDF2708717.1 transporter permease [Nonomuraea muscovyensis]